MYRILFMALAIFTSQIVFSGDIPSMESFDRSTLKIEDEWSGKEIGYKDSDLVTFFRKNLGVKEISGHPNLQYLVYLTISYEVDGPEGLPSKKDYDLITEFENVDLPIIEFDSNSIHVATVLKNGVKDLLIYVSDPDTFIEVLNKNNSKLKGFKIDLELAHDPKWEIYADFP